jgi:DNA invertase Pin-like site-specific DNA recombinase
MKKFVSWRRVSTKKQEKSGLGLEAQQDIISHFVNTEKGELIADFCEAYTGKDLNGCVELRKAIEFAKANDAILIIAKSDRFRNTIEALQIYNEMGEGKIYFCDLPHTDKFTLTVFFALAEREAMLISIRTKAALAVQKKRIEQDGYFISKAGNKCTSLGGTTSGQAKGGKANGEKRRKEAMESSTNRIIAAMTDGVTSSSELESIAIKLNNMGIRTSSGLEFNRNRLSALISKIKKRNLFMLNEA